MEVSQNVNGFSWTVVHEQVEAAVLRLLFPHLRAERPQSQYAQLDALQTEGNPHNRNHQRNSCQQILQGDAQTAKNNPNDVS